ncbi:signal peptidase [Diplodia corticola]|uniref:Signal peptidase n=1 Tax=Diplodia corticola TaxID=236234 RepID=A0A1J9QNI4_9PEZI|nr:signal peptidase [Diplodia corticola]OJD30462.1 signal peptidase [Diplodia corticola]
MQWCDRPESVDGNKARFKHDGDNQKRVQAKLPGLHVPVAQGVAKRVGRWPEPQNQQSSGIDPGRPGLPSAPATGASSPPTPGPPSSDPASPLPTPLTREEDRDKNGDTEKEEGKEKEMPLPRFGSLPLTAPRLLFHTFASALCLHVIVLTHGYNVKFTYGPSMAPTMGAFGDAVVISKLHRRGRNIVVGDLVSYENPFCLDYGIIKRVIAMPGDFVLRDTPGAERGQGLMVQVPEGHCWVAGDNQLHSRDSRLYGPVPLALIRGKVIARVMPFSEACWFKNTLTEPTDEELDELD